MATPKAVRIRLFSPLTVIALLTLLSTTLIGSANAEAHFSLPGSTKCRSVSQQSGTDSLASQIRVKGVRCGKVRNWLRPGNQIPKRWKCSFRNRPNGDRYDRMPHADIRCSSPNGKKKFVFVST